MVNAPSPSCPRLRDTPGTLHNHDPLGHDRQPQPAADRRIHPNLARRFRHNGRTTRSLDETPSKQVNKHGLQNIACASRLGNDVHARCLHRLQPDPGPAWVPPSESRLYAS